MLGGGESFGIGAPLEIGMIGPRQGHECVVEKLGGADVGCLGALATGTVLVPVLGVSGACLAVVAIKALSAVQVGLAATMRP